MTARALGATKRRAIDSINAAADAARWRYDEASPRQATVNATKLAQARAYLASFTGNRPGAEPGRYLVMEALARAETERRVAQRIVKDADDFDADTGPLIEAARVRGVLSVQAATTVELAVDALNASLAELRAA